MRFIGNLIWLNVALPCVIRISLPWWGNHRLQFCFWCPELWHSFITPLTAVWPVKVLIGSVVSQGALKWLHPSTLANSEIWNRAQEDEKYKDVQCKEQEDDGGYSHELLFVLFKNLVDLERFPYIAKAVTQHHGKQCTCTHSLSISLSLSLSHTHTHTTN